MTVQFILRFVAVTAIASAMLALPSTAGAAAVPDTTSLDGGRLVIDVPLETPVVDHLILINDTGGSFVVNEVRTGAVLPPIDPSAATACNFTGMPIAQTQMTCLFNTGGLAQALGLKVYAGDGDDTVAFSGPQPVEIYGEVGSDGVSGGSGNDLIVGGDDTDLGSDAVGGGAGNDTLYAGGGDDTLSGGTGLDTFFGGLGNLDLVDYSFESRASGVSVSLNDVADDTEGENIGGSPSSIGIEGVVGTEHSDTVIGDLNSNLLYGMAGSDNLYGVGGSDSLYGDFGARYASGTPAADYLYGGVGNDSIFGEQGADQLDGRDSEADAAINCGTDGGGTATVDAADVDTVVHNCTTVNRPSPPVVVTPTPTDPTPVNPVKPIVVAGVTIGTFVDTTVTKKIPDVRGQFVFDAANKLSATKLNIEFDSKTVELSKAQLPKNIKPFGGVWKPGYVVSQTSVGKSVSTGVATEFKVTLVIWAGLPKADCISEAQAFAVGKKSDLALAEFKEILQDLGCNLDDVRIDLEASTKQPGEIDLVSGDRCEVDKVFKSGRNEVDVELDIPQNPDQQDLRVYAMHSGDGLSLVEGDGSLTATYSSYAQAFRIYVGSRSAGQSMNKVTLYLHYKSTSGDYDRTLQNITGAANQAAGTARFRVATPHPGTVWIAAVGIDQNGRSVCGSTFIPVVERPTSKSKHVAPGDELTTIGGVSWTMTGAADFRRTVGKSSAGVEKSTARAGVTTRGWLDQIGALWNKLFGNAQPAAATAVANAADKPAAIKAIEETNKVQLALWRVNPGAIGPAAQIISGGAGNIISGGAGNIISGGAGNAVATTAEGAVAVTVAGGNRAFGFQEGAGIISGGAGNFQSGAGATDMKTSEILVAANGGTIISGGGGNIISGGAGNIISGGAGNIISGGAGN